METVYSGMFLAEANNLELWGADAGHPYNLQALTREKLYTVGGPECWNDKFFEILHQFKPSRAVIQFPPEMVENWWRYGGELVTK